MLLYTFFFQLAKLFHPVSLTRPPRNKLNKSFPPLLSPLRISEFIRGKAHKEINHTSIFTMPPSWTTLSCMHLVRNPKCSSSLPSFLTPNYWPTSNKMSTQNFQVIFLRVKQDHPWHQGWPCSPCLWSGSLNILNVFTFLKPPFLTHLWYHHKIFIHNIKDDLDL